MQLFFDIDGVLLNFEHTFVRWLNNEHALGLPDHYEAENWDFDEVLEREKLVRSWHSFLESTESGRMPTLVDPGQFNTLVRDHRVHLVTNFPQPYMDKRLDNLSRHGFAYETLHYCGLHPYKDFKPQTKAQVIEDLLASGEQGLFIDDHPENCLDVHRHCPEVEVWLMSRRFNRDFDHPEIQRARDWDCLFDRLAPAGNGNGSSST